MAATAVQTKMDIVHGIIQKLDDEVTWAVPRLQAAVVAGEKLPWGLNVYATEVGEVLKVFQIVEEGLARLAALTADGK